MRRILDQSRNFLGARNHNDWPEKAGVVVLPVNFEKTSSYGKGSDQGPGAILAASHHIEFYDARLGFSPFEKANGIVTAAPFKSSENSGLVLASELAKEVDWWLKAGKRVVTLGGEHTSIVGAIQAHAGHYTELTVLQLDAHSDLRSTYLDDPWNHACAMSRVLDFHKNIVQAGIRSQSGTEKKTSSELNLPVFYSESIHEQERMQIDWISEIIQTLSQRVYISFDCDVLDPSIIPATGTPEPGGLTWFQVDRLFHRICMEREVVGFDISELAPIKTIHHPQFTIAKLIYRLIGYMFMTINNE